jgi:hypothetical protein
MASAYIGPSGKFRHFCRSDVDRVVELLPQAPQIVFSREFPQVSQYVDNPFLRHEKPRLF